MMTKEAEIVYELPLDESRDPLVELCGLAKMFTAVMGPLLSNYNSAETIQ